MDDEGLGSWLARVAAGYCVSVQALLAHLGVQRSGIRCGNWLALQELAPADMLILARALRRPTIMLADMATSAWSLSATAEIGMCATCVLQAREEGDPIYWQRAWLDSVTTVCAKHGTWLTPVEARHFIQAPNWHGPDEIVAGIAHTAASASAGHIEWPSPISAVTSAMRLQSLFTPSCTDEAVDTDRYGMASLVQARLVALDLLDMLLAADCATGRSMLFEFAALLDIPVALDGISISGRHGRTVRIRRVKKLGARCFATTIADHLMCGSMPDTGHAGSTRLRFDPRSLRTHWLWPLIPQPSLDLLVQRAKNWPRGYVGSCWPELENIDRTPMLQRKRKLIAAHRAHENLGKAIVN